MAAEITITIRPDGTVETRVNGVKGKACRDLTKPIRDALGETEHDRATSELYESEQAGERVRGGRR